MQNRKEIKAIIFDVDGVLMHSLDKNGRFLWLKDIEHDIGLKKSHLEKIFSYEWIDLIKGKVESLNYLQKIWADDSFKDLNLKPEDFINYWLTHDLAINIEMLDLISKIRIPCYLGTNQERLRTKKILQKIGYYFENCFASYKIGYIKPEIEFFQHIENKLEIPSQQLLLVDDILANINAARDLKWQTFHYKNNTDEFKQFIVNI